jgi:hypothetical protein
MKRLVYLLCFTLLMVGCNGHRHPKPTLDTHLSVKGDTEVWVGCNGNKNYKITCLTRGGDSSVSIAASSSVDWIEIDGYQGNTAVIYDVAPNDSDEQRRGVITIRYSNKSTEVTIVQMPKAEYEFEARTLSGSEYYGQSPTNDGLYNYYIVLSEDGLSDEGYLYGESTYYFFDLYSEMPTSNYNRWRVPLGIYSIDDGSIGAEYSYSANTKINDNITERAFTAATIEVTSIGIRARLTLETGESANVWYRGSLEVKSLDENPLSTLEGDYNFDIKGATLIGTFDSSLSQGCKALKLYIFEHFDWTTGLYSGDLFQLTLLLPDDATDIAGMYRRGMSSYSFVAGGEIVDSGGVEPCDSWYMTADNSRVAPIKSGEIEITKGEDELYTISMNLRDDANNSIVGKIETTVHIVE